MKKAAKGIWGALASCLCLSLSACGGDLAESGGAENIFTYAVEVEDGVFSPKGADFGTPVKEVLRAKGLTEAAVEEDSGNDAKRIINRIGIEGLSDEIMEIIRFEDDELITVIYAIGVEQSDFETACRTLQEQAAAYIPAELLISEGNAVLGADTGLSWEDKEKNMIYLNCPMTQNDGKKTIMLSINSAVTEE